jgi:hypothetical protein
MRNMLNLTLELIYQYSLPKLSLQAKECNIYSFNYIFSIITST